MVNYKGLISTLNKSDENLGLLSMQATGTAAILMKEFPDRLKALFSAEHGFFGTVPSGEITQSAWHPFWNLPIHSLYGDFQKPTDSMLEGLGRIVIDLCDIGVRCCTYLATMKNMLESCASAGIPVTILDREIPMGNVLDGPMLKRGYESFVAPVNVPFCHSMTPAECALWIRNAESLDLDLTIVKLRNWSHFSHDPWPNFVPLSPDIRTWDSATCYPMTVFTEAFPAIDSDRDGPMAFRVIGAPWLDMPGLIDDLRGPLETCGIEMRPYRYSPKGGHYAGFNLNGILFSISRPIGYYPVTAGVLILTAIIQRHGAKVLAGSNPGLLDNIFGSSDVTDILKGGDIDLGDIFQSWIDGQDEYLKTKVDLYVSDI